MKKILSFINKWSDILVFVPISLFLFIFNGFLIRGLDETASIVNVEFLSILNFNILVFGLITTIAWFIYNKMFHDFFKRGWEKSLSPVMGGVLHIVLWLSILITAYLCISRNL